MDTGRIVEILSKLVAFDTTSRNSNLELIGWVEEYLRCSGVQAERLYDRTGQKANLLAALGPRTCPASSYPARPTWCRSTARTGRAIRFG